MRVRSLFLSVPALFNRALVNTRVGNDAAALIDLNLAVSIEPRDPDLLHNRALIHRRNVRPGTRTLVDTSASCLCPHPAPACACAREPAPAPPPAPPPAPICVLSVRGIQWLCSMGTVRVHRACCSMLVAFPVERRAGALVHHVSVSSAFHQPPPHLATVTTATTRPLQRRFVDARNDYVKLYTLRQVPLSLLNAVDMEAQTVLYSPTPVDGKPGTVSKM